MADATLRVSADTRDAERALGRINKQLSLIKVSAILDLGAKAIDAVKGFASLADEITNIQNRLKTSLPYYQSTAQGFEDIYKIAQSAGAPLSSVAELYTKLALNGAALGLSQEKIATVTDVVTKAIQLSGASSQAASAGITQFGQALASGALQGDELRSILENTPVLAKAIADGLGITIGQLRRYGSEGKLTSDVVIRALESQRQVIDNLSGSRVPTLEQAFNRLGNSLLKIFGAANDVTGAGGSLAEVITKLSESIDNLSKNALQLEVYLNALGAVAIVALIGYISTLIPAGITLTAVLSALGAAAAFVASPLFIIGAIIGVVVAAVMGLNSILKWANMSFKEFFDTLTDGGLLNIIDNFEKLKNKIVSNRVEIEKAQEAEKKRLKAIDEAQKAKQIETKQQEDFNKSFEKGLRPQEYELKLKQSSIYYSDTELKVLTEINKQREAAISQGAKLLDSQAKRIREVITENAALEKQSKLRKDIIDAGTETVTRAARAADPRIAAETEYQNAKIALENYFVENSMFTQEQYYATLKQIEDQYRLEKYNAELALIDNIAKYREMDMARQLQQQKDLLGNARFGSETIKQMTSERTAFDKKSESEKAAWAIEQTASVFDSLGKYNKKAFEASKAFNIANAIMNTYMGATKALATYPPPFNFIGAAAVVASGLAQVAQIRSQQYSGRAIGGPVASNTPYIVGENGPEMFVPQGAGKVVPNNQLGSSPVNISFNINTVDARGMDQLLMERKGMIVGMVRSAINDRGVKAPM